MKKDVINYLLMIFNHLTIIQNGNVGLVNFNPHDIRLENLNNEFFYYYKVILNKYKKVVE